jgi:broad specificity polyphosphatase/5'/3'-nucleotidase SurE
MDDPFDTDLAAEYAFGVIEQLKNLQDGCVANINIPLLSKSQPKGVLVVPQSVSGFDEFYDRSHTNGQATYRLSGGTHRDSRQDFLTDTTALEAGYITITALRKDLTDRIANELLSAMEIQIAPGKKEFPADDPCI